MFMCPTSQGFVKHFTLPSWSCDKRLIVAVNCFLLGVSQVNKVFVDLDVAAPMPYQKQQFLFDENILMVTYRCYMVNALAVLRWP